MGGLHLKPTTLKAAAWGLPSVIHPLVMHSSGTPCSVCLVRAMFFTNLMHKNRQLIIQTVQTFFEVWPLVFTFQLSRDVSYLSCKAFPTNFELPSLISWRRPHGARASDPWPATHHAAFEGTVEVMPLRLSRFVDVARLEPSLGFQGSVHRSNQFPNEVDLIKWFRNDFPTTIPNRKRCPNFWIWMKLLLNDFCWVHRVLHLDAGWEASFGGIWQTLQHFQLCLNGCDSPHIVGLSLQSLHWCKCPTCRAGQLGWNWGNSSSQIMEDLRVLGCTKPHNFRNFEACIAVHCCAIPPLTNEMAKPQIQKVMQFWGWVLSVLIRCLCKKLALKRLKPARPVRCSESGPLPLRDGEGVSISSSQEFVLSFYAESKGQKTRIPGFHDDPQQSAMQHNGRWILNVHAMTGVDKIQVSNLK